MGNGQPTCLAGFLNGGDDPTAISTKASHVTRRLFRVEGVVQQRKAILKEPIDVTSCFEVRWSVSNDAFQRVQVTCSLVIHSENGVSSRTKLPMNLATNHLGGPHGGRGVSRIDR